MKKIMILLMVLLWITSAWGIDTYTNGTGNVSDTAVFSSWVLDSNDKSLLSQGSINKLTLYQTFRGAVFDSLIITNPGSYDIFTDAPFFEMRRRASNSAGSTGVYRWYVKGTSDDSYDTPIAGKYLVINDSTFWMADVFTLFKALLDTLQSQDGWVSQLTDAQVRDAVGDSTHAIAGEYKADVSGLSTFNPATTPVVARDTTNSGKTLAVKEDSLIYQGSGGGSDTTSIKAMMIGNQFARVDEDTTIDINSDGTVSATASIPDSLFDTLTVIHEDIEALSLTGGGTEPETLIIIDANDSTLIQSAKITIRTLDQSTTKAAGLLTDVNGKRIFALDSDSFWVEITHNNYVQIMDTLVIASGGGTDSLFMTEFDPGNPSDPDLCRVYGWVYDISGEDIYGVDVAAEIPRLYHPVKYSDLIITPFSKSTATDSSGYWYIDLIPCSKLTGDNIKYQFIIKYNSGVIFRTETDVPDSASWQLK